MAQNSQQTANSFPKVQAGTRGDGAEEKSKKEPDILITSVRPQHRNSKSNYVFCNKQHTIS